MRRRTIPQHWFTLFLVCIPWICGCVTQQLIVTTEPPGAEVYFNGQHLGRSPVTHEFLWYEPYQVRVEHADHDPLQENGVLKAPMWMYVPLDGLMAVLPVPFKDRHYVTFNFANPTAAQIEAAIAGATDTSIATHTGVLDDLRRIHQ